MAVSIRTALAATTLTLVMAGCEAHDVVTFRRVATDSATWVNPASGDPSFINDPNRPYNYLYYPSTQVYYSIQEDMFYYPDQGQWKSAWRLPRRFSFIHAPYEEVVLSSNRPYYHHDDVAAMHPADDYVLIQVSEMASVIPPR